jgi:hypothetical protein
MHTQSILSAVALDQKLQEHRLLELAIQWNNLPMISQVLAGDPGVAVGDTADTNAAKPTVAVGDAADTKYAKWDRTRYNMQAALQLALELQKGEHCTRALTRRTHAHAELNSCWSCTPRAWPSHPAGSRALTPALRPPFLHRARAADVVAMLLSNGADVGCVFLSRLYMIPEKTRFRLFLNMQARCLPFWGGGGASACLSSCM